MSEIDFLRGRMVELSLSVDALVEDVGELRKAIKTADRNHWRREFVKVTLPYAHAYANAPERRMEGINYADVAVGMADQILAAIEAREKEDAK